jgi:hypothetical protein
MDLNDLYHRRGVSLLMAQYAPSEQSRGAHRALAAACAATIAKFVRRPGLVPA